MAIRIVCILNEGALRADHYRKREKMKEEVIELTGLSCFEAERKIAERYDLGETINSSSFENELKLGAHDHGMLSTENGSLVFHYIVDRLNDDGYVIRIFSKRKQQYE